MKTFSNIVIIALIGLFSSTYLFNLSPIDYRGTIEIETPAEESTLKLETDKKELLNPESITINHVSDKEEVLKSIANSIFTVSIYRDSAAVKENLTNLELVSPSNNMTISIDTVNPMVTTLDISQKKLGLEDGTYSFVFSSNLIADKNKSSVSVSVTYDTQGTYYPASDAAQAGKKGLTLYFASPYADTLIPVTRFVVEDKSITRMAIEQLQNGPVSGSLKTVIGDVTNTTYNNGNVVIDIPGSYANYNNGSTGGLMAYDAFRKTIFAVKRYWPIYNLTFTVDRKHVDSYFHGIDKVNAIPSTDDNYVLYMAYKIDGRYYLFEFKTDETLTGIASGETAELKAQKLFDAYKDTSLTYGINPIPEGVVLNSAKIQGTQLMLDFGDSLLKAYSGKNDLRQMMIDSFAYTFNTIPGVDSIKITVNGDALNSFIDGKDLSGAIYPPEFINPEITNEQ
ncbi:MAG: GerMN domain-containing protein [Sedimentibacter sp.]|uniref:GerMN domain-containing protein n=1 Tax=Sedimentibacter sp. TaxID=1960295 RepID=UPI003158E3B5